ncbi:ATP-grasp domain-containing protein [Actinoplanes oblitus]|uniref:ATP-grasp domain-containing protein n=1 Tax=Actinoplanes oblitus TaxID=3040509 RepID=A0ABY8WQU2_9ACTN|nr:ATP-grasp domain-containing protein [Actinoplanes oblitus]WIM99832.1 ATP-grasp domain-containing protein [Actinoplanes oblitus]
MFVVLVDAYTSGKYLLPEFTALGAGVVHVQSTAEFMASMPAPDLSGYAARIVHRDLAGTAASLRPYAPVRVLAGQEPGVLLADALARELGLPMNDPDRSEARRDKYLMIDAVRSAGLHCADQFTSGDPAELAAWRPPGGYPVVVKPRRSAAGDSVFICDTADQVRAAAAAVLGSATIYGEANPQALVQSYLRGTEYVVDMVSHDGHRYVCGVWEYRKRLLPSGRNIYDRERLLAPDEAPAAELMAYVDRALDALGIRFGPTHAEVILTPDGPALVEVGCRLAGNMHPGFHDHCAGGNQATLAALEVVRPRDFLDRYAGRHYDKRAEAICCTTSTTLDGVVAEVDEAVAAEIAALESVHRFDLKLGPGSRIRPTVDLYSSTMRIFMSAAEMAVIDRDYRRIEQLKDRVYRLREEVGAR